MRFYLQRHQFYCGIDLHAKKMFLCILDEQGSVVLHRNIPTDPESLRRTLQPFREGLVIGVECMFSWYQAGIPTVCDAQGSELQRLIRPRRSPAFTYTLEIRTRIDELRDRRSH